MFIKTGHFLDTWYLVIQVQKRTVALSAFHVLDIFDQIAVFV